MRPPRGVSEGVRFMADVPPGGIRPGDAPPSSWPSRPGGGGAAPAGVPRFRPPTPSGDGGSSAPAATPGAPSGGPGGPNGGSAAPAPQQEAPANLQDFFVTRARQGRGELKPVEDLHIDELLHTVVEKNASDLHIAAGIPPIIREQGALVPMPYERMSPTETQRMMYDILTD